MNERILNLLLLCLKAKEAGEDVFFDYSPHVQKVGIYSYSDLEKTLVSKEDEPCPRKIDCNFYLDDEPREVNETINKVEKQINNLIKKGSRIS